MDRAGPVAIEGNLVIGGAGAGLQIATNVPMAGRMTCNTFGSSTIGLHLNIKRADAGGFGLVIEHNVFGGQAQYGVASTVGFTLANNWWGDASGPYEPQQNPQGRGVPVGITVAAQAWLTERQPCAPPQ